MPESIYTSLGNIVEVVTCILAVTTILFTLLFVVFSKNI
jgi:hypothetical protein